MASFFKKGEVLLGFFKFTRNKHNEIVLRPVIGRILLALAGLGVAGWMAAAFAVMIFVEQARGFQGGSYVDLLFYPWRKENYQKAWGDEFIERGLALLDKGEVQEGVHLIRVGHVKSPGNLEGRLFLADLYSAQGRKDLAAELLRQGLSYARDDIDYVRKTLQLLISIQEDQAVKEVAADLLPGLSESEAPVLTPVNKTIALAAATANFHRGAYAQAENFLLKYELTNNPEGRILLARIDWESGNRREALNRLEALAGRFTDQDEVYILLSRYYRELGDHGKAHHYAVMRQVSDPLSPAPRIALLYSYHSAGDLARAEQVAERLFRDFGHNREALLGLAEFATFTGNVDLCRHAFQAIDRAGFPLELPIILLAEAHLNAGEFREAITLLENQSKENEAFAERFEAILNSIYAVCYLGLGNTDAADMHLTRFLDARGVRAEHFLLTSERLLKIGEAERARRVVMQAHQSDPLNQAALIEMIRMDLAAGHGANLIPSLNKLLSMRKPPRALLEESATVLSSDNFLFLPRRNKLLESIEEALTASREPTVVTRL